MVRGREAVGLDVAAGETDAEDGQGRMDCLGKKIRGEREGADVFKHGYFRTYVGPREG